MNFLDELIRYIKSQNGNKDLNLNENEYHVFLKDAHVLIYLDDEKTLKVDVNMFDEDSAEVYFNGRLKLEEFM